MQEAQEDKANRLIIVDSFSKWEEYCEQYHRMTDTGWDIYNNYNSDIQQMLDWLKLSPIPICLFGIDEILQMDTTDEHVTFRTRRLKVYGKRLEGMLEKEFSVVLFTNNKKQSNGRVSYEFLTNNDGSCSAKTPEGMFGELLIPNDLQMVYDRMGEYFKGQTITASKTQGAPKASAGAKRRRA